MKSQEFSKELFTKMLADFNKVHIKTVKKVFIASPSYYKQAEEVFKNSDVTVILSQGIDNKTVGYLVDSATANNIIQEEIKWENKTETI